MSTHGLETTINIFQDDTVNYIEVAPPLEEFELEALEWTGAREFLFEETKDSENKTTLWSWRIREDEGLSTPQAQEVLSAAGLERFATRAFAYQVSLLREMQGHKVNNTDNF